MDKKVAGTVIGIVAVAMIAGIAVLALRQSAPQDSASDTMNDMPASQQTQSEGLGFGESKADSTVRSGETELAIEGFAFRPSEITVKKGTTVTWTNRDDAHHDITPDENKPGAPEQSKLLAEGESYSFTFDTVGEFSYHCSPHPYMKAKVTVVE